MTLSIMASFLPSLSFVLSHRSNNCYFWSRFVARLQVKQQDKIITMTSFWTKSEFPFSYLLFVPDSRHFLTRENNEKQYLKWLWCVAICDVMSIFSAPRSSCQHHHHVVLSESCTCAVRNIMMEEPFRDTLCCDRPTSFHIPFSLK